MWLYMFAWVDLMQDHVFSRAHGAEELLELENESKWASSWNSLDETLKGKENIALLKSMRQ